MRKVTPPAAGVDIGAHEIGACEPDGAEPPGVRTFGTYTADLQNLADWFVDRGIETVARESRGVGRPRSPLLFEQCAIDQTCPRP
jgi:hypothetical protein